MDYNDFKNYAINHLGISGMEMHYWEKTQETIYGGPMVVTGSLTPMVTERSTQNLTQMSIFDKMMQDRIIWLVGVVNDRMKVVTQAQLLYLDQISATDDINCYIDSPGGSVPAGLGMVDVMNYVAPDISTLCTGLAASMGSILLGAGTKGKRYLLPHAKVMLHQLSSGTRGNIQDQRITMQQSEEYNVTLFDLLSDYTGKPAETILTDTNRDLWLTSKQAVEYGIADGIVPNKK